MRLTMSENAQGDGAWGTVLNKLAGFTFEVTKTDQTFFVGRIIEADEIEVTFVVEPQKYANEQEVTVDIDHIEEMEYL